MMIKAIILMRIRKISSDCSQHSRLFHIWPISLSQLSHGNEPPAARKRAETPRARSTTSALGRSSAGGVFSGRTSGIPIHHCPRGTPQGSQEGLIFGIMFQESFWSICAIEDPKKRVGTRKNGEKNNIHYILWKKWFSSKSHLSGLEPSRDAMEVEGMIAHTPSHCAFLRQPTLCKGPLWDRT